MNKKLICLSIILILIIQIPVIFSEETNRNKKSIEKYQIYDSIDYSKYGNFTITENGMIKTDDGWYYYPPYPNYAPSGMPDFDQRQDNWICWYGSYDWCGLVSQCNVLWYLDSKNSDPNGYPGDGVDNFPLVQDYNAPSNPNPGPYSDDHNINNVNDVVTSWNNDVDIEDCEFIERFTWFNYNNKGGLIGWIKDAGLYSKIRNIFWYATGDVAGNFDFYDVVENITMNNYYFVIGFDRLNDDGSFYSTWRHYVTISGVNVDELKIAISDPSGDKTNPTRDKEQHNDAYNVSHDVYDVIPVSPFEGYGWGYDFGTYLAMVDNMIIFYENNPPEIPNINGPTTGEIGREYSYNFSSSDKEEATIYYMIDWGMVI